jgi:hypothetical protein
MIQTPTLFITGIVSFALLLFALQIKFRKISKNANVFLFNQRYSEENLGDVNFDHIEGREKQIDTLYNFIAEMVMIGETDFVFYYSVHWPSTYMYYSFAHNENITILHINNLK